MKIRLVLSDVDGTLIDSNHALTPEAREAVSYLKKAGILFAITSGRPPRGLSELIQELQLETPVASFNGGMILDPNEKPISILEQKVLPQNVTESVIFELEQAGHDVWLYRGNEWYLRNPKVPHALKEMRAVKFNPIVVDSFRDLTDQVVKVLGVNDDTSALSKSADDLKKKLTGTASASLSQSYYLDVTHLDANKGAVVKFLSKYFGISPLEIATLGDMPNDIQMFECSGLSIAMGNASDEVKKFAKKVTTANDDNGFARAIMKFL